MRQALEALQFSSAYLDELGAKLFPSTKKAKPGSTAWHVQEAMAALRGRLDAAERRVNRPPAEGVETWKRTVPVVRLNA